MEEPTSQPQSSGKATVRRVFGTPMVVKGRTWLPVIEGVVWAGMTWYAGRLHPGWSALKRIISGGLNMAALLGSEWCHNLAHAAAARWIGKPMDELRILFGMPRVVYRHPNDPQVTPHQHILRSLGGPIFNALVLPFAFLLRWLSPRDSMARDFGGTLVTMNAFTLAAALLPIPGLDGGPVLKWSLVEWGKTPSEADAGVRRANQAVGAGLGALAGTAFARRRWIAGGVCAFFAIIAGLVGFGILKEKD